MRLSPDAEEAWDSFQQYMDDAAQREKDRDDKRELDPYFDRKDNLSETSKGKVVTVDAAITALHLVAARLAFKVLPNVLRIACKNVLFTLENFATKQIADKAARRKPGIAAVLTVLKEIAKFFGDIYIQRVVEQRIREAATKMREELVKRALAQVGRDRRTKEVLTRNYSPPQRRKNKSWRSPRA